ncbi:MAG: heme-binding beta-barrel domain-containing protein [Actinomycetota bacterium]|nr:heme-binding beta-barrel domain-containing protein [Actinomycetota bacterium]
MTAPEDLTPSNFGPLLALVGTWEGHGGVDFSYHHDDKEVGDTEYFERVTMSTFGPVDNGTQALFGLDYRMAAWRSTELDQDPFHTEVGYWLYDPRDQQIMRCFMVPRGTVAIAGGTCAPDATSFELEADLGSTTYGILSNRYLDQHARTERYTATITIGDDQWSYEEDTVLAMTVQDELLHHTDRNTLHRVAESG